MREQSHHCSCSLFWSSIIIRDRKSGTHFVNTSRDDSANSVLLFPGQGSQFVGMGKQLMEEGGEVTKAVKPLYERASQLLDYDLLKVVNGVCFYIKLLFANYVKKI